uniref:Arf-GAP with coiled-coil, ANK repeat and PH domain-containing protein n=1 Tax=Prolemur simus TaxID=1328070 RepID=A0A8C9DL57_PROSS
MTVEFEECVKDSPRFRATIDEVEADVVEVEAKLDKLVKLCSGMIEAGKAYVSTNRLFVSGIRDLSQQCQGDTVISVRGRLTSDRQVWAGVEGSPLRGPRPREQLGPVREDMELSLVRNAQAPRHRPHEVEEAAGALSLTRKCFRHLALDYVLQVGSQARSGGSGGSRRGQGLGSCSEGWGSPAG